LAIVDSASMAQIFSRQTNTKLIWIEESMEGSEALVVHNRYHASGGGTIRTPMDLRGRRIGVEFGSTSHYALATYYNEFSAKVLYDTTYQRLHKCGTNPEGQLIPCHFTNQSDAVTFFGLTPDEMEEQLAAGTIHAAYVGFPHLHRMKKYGSILMTNSEAARWQKVTFRGIVATEKFLERPGVPDFLRAYFITTARANFYWKNNTKEFTLYYRGRYSVSAKVAAVIPNGVDTDVFTNMVDLEFPTLQEQASKDWMGGGLLSRVAYSLYDHSILFNSLKDDQNVRRFTEITSKISTQNMREVVLPAVMKLEEYVKYIDVSYVQSIVDQNITDAYHLQPEDAVHLGYQISDVHGPTISITTADACDLYPSAKYPTSVLTPDVKTLPKCRCREYYLFGWCVGDPLYDTHGYYCLRRSFNTSANVQYERRAALAAVVEDLNPNCVGARL